jgi:hypothetical protein
MDYYFPKGFNGGFELFLLKTHTKNAIENKNKKNKVPIYLPYLPHLVAICEIYVGRCLSFFLFFAKSKKWGWGGGGGGENSAKNF